MAKIILINTQKICNISITQTRHIPILDKPYKQVNSIEAKTWYSKYMLILSVEMRTLDLQLQIKSIYGCYIKSSKPSLPINPRYRYDFEVYVTYCKTFL